MNKLRLPAINAPTVEGKLDQIRSYLFQLTEYMNQLSEAVEVHCASPDAHSDTAKNQNKTSFIQTMQRYGQSGNDV